jgi:hypothetical protein
LAVADHSMVERVILESRTDKVRPNVLAKPGAFASCHLPTDYRSLITGIEDLPDVDPGVGRGRGVGCHRSTPLIRFDRECSSAKAEAAESDAVAASGAALALSWE